MQTCSTMAKHPIPLLTLYRRSTQKHDRVTVLLSVSLGRACVSRNHFFSRNCGMATMTVFDRS